jgi:hypothetical protein
MTTLVVLDTRRPCHYSGILRNESKWPPGYSRARVVVSGDEEGYHSTV